MTGKKRRTTDDAALTRRQTQVMQTLHALGEASVSDVQQALEREDVELSYASVKSALRSLLLADRVRTTRRGRATHYLPATSREETARSSITRWVRTFFQGDGKAALITFLDAAETDLSPEDMARLRSALNPTSRMKQARKK